MSIKLTTPFIVSIGGSQVEDDTDGACTSIVTDFLARTQTVTFQIGTLIVTPPPPATGGTTNLNVGAQSVIQNQTVIVTIHLDTGDWSDNHGHSGVLPANILSTVTGQYVGDRNTAESYVAPSGGLMPGVITQWTQP